MLFFIIPNADILITVKIQRGFKLNFQSEVKQDNLI